ncbi:MAG: phosphopantetheine-binding protein [Nitrospinae bacterium]|nr:phosphopantetheine-binding protein [Nitrospinota bacterium]
MSQNLVSDDTILDEVKKAIAHTTGIDEKTIEPDSSLVDDLGVLSLDFLDVNFRLEQVFGIKMPRNFVLEHAEEMFGEGVAINEESEVTEAGVEVLKLRLNEAAAELEPGTPVDELPALVTPNTLASAVRDVLNCLPEKSPAGADWKAEDGTRIVCAETNEPASLPSGDEVVQSWLSRVQEERGLFSS